MKKKQKTFVIAFDSGAKGVRYIDDEDSKRGTFDEYSAKTFDTKEEAQKYIDDNNYVAWVQELEAQE